MATYGEGELQRHADAQYTLVKTPYLAFDRLLTSLSVQSGEPTDNAVALMDFIKEPSFESGGSTLDNLNYVVFGLGNRWVSLAYSC